MILLITHMSGHRHTITDVDTLRRFTSGAWANRDAVLVFKRNEEGGLYPAGSPYDLREVRIEVLP